MNFHFNKKINFLHGVIIALTVITVLISLQSFGSGKHFSEGRVESNFNNFLIFKASATHLINGIDLYKLHPTEHYDLYKYSPTFAFFMLPFAALPDWLGLICWNLLNLFFFIRGVKLLPGLNKKQIIVILLVGIFELIGSIMNEQSNVLMSGLMLLTLVQFERKNPFWGVFFLVLSVYIKLFSIVLFMMLLFYPNKIKTAAYTLFWFIILGIIPAVITGFSGLNMQYISWFGMLQNDFDASIGYSVLGILHTWFSYSGSKLTILALGVLLMVAPLFKFDEYKRRHFRYSVLSALLIWVIIFNHKAESPTFIIAMTGIGLYFAINEFNLLNKVLLVFCILFISLVYSDIMPSKFRDSFFHPYFIKAFPCIIIWIKLIVEIVFNKFIQLWSMAAKLITILLFNKQYNHLLRNNAT